MTELIREEDLRRSGLSAEELLVKFKEQLYRDFEMCGLKEFLGPPGNSFDSIRQCILEALDKMGSSRIQQLLYRVDISEKQYGDSLDAADQEQRHDALTLLIIKRVLQKVILKVIYSK